MNKLGNGLTIKGDWSARHIHSSSDCYSERLLCRTVFWAM